MSYSLNLVTAWSGFIAGAVSGAFIGLFFHRDIWLGGYSSFSRRLLRLGHIAFFGLGFLNLMFYLCVKDMPQSFWLNIASPALLIALATMSLVCFLSSWRPLFRHFFFIPTGATLVGIISTLAGVA